MSHPDQHTPDDHRSSKRDDAPEPDIEKDLDEDLTPEGREELEEEAGSGTSVRAEEPEEDRTGEYGHTYMGRQMDDSLKGKDRRPRDEDELTGESEDEKEEP